MFLNVLWLLLGGFWMAMGWYLAGILMFLTILGIPWAKACFRMGGLSLWPFGKEVVNRRELTGQGDIGTGAVGLVGNIIWILLGGFWLAVGHLAAALANFVTIIGIPFAVQHVKLAQLAIAPIGKEIVTR